MFFLGNKTFIFLVLLTGAAGFFFNGPTLPNKATPAPPTLRVKDKVSFKQSTTLPSPVPTKVGPRRAPEGINSQDYAPLQDQLEEQGIAPEHARALLKKDIPESVHLWREGKLVVLNAPQSLIAASGSKKILNLSDINSIQKIKEQRQQESLLLKAAPYLHFPDKYLALKPSAYELLRFTPGLKDDRQTYIYPHGEPTIAILGPDYSHENILPTDIEGLKVARMKVLSLGHTGEVTIKVSEDGVILNHSASHFVVYENVFRVGDDIVYQEFAHVGVSEVDREDQYKWFPCDPKKGDILHCAGVVPTGEGGDVFDLNLLNVKKVKFIKIRDTGLNFNNMGANTEGFDLDALSLIQAFKKR